MLTYLGLSSIIPIIHRRIRPSVFTEANYHKYRLQYSIAIKNRFKTFMLWWQHDSDFDLELFKEGAKQAISVITERLRDKRDTYPYLSIHADHELKKLSQTWENSVRKNVFLEPSEIRQIIIANVQHIKFDDATIYQITTIGIGYKQHEHYSKWLRQTILLCRFERIYNESVVPEWNVIKFDIKKMRIIRI